MEYTQLTEADRNHLRAVLTYAGDHVLQKSECSRLKDKLSASWDMTVQQAIYKLRALGLHGTIKVEHIAYGNSTDLNGEDKITIETENGSFFARSVQGACFGAEQRAMYEKTVVRREPASKPRYCEHCGHSLVEDEKGE